MLLAIPLLNTALAAAPIVAGPFSVTPVFHGTMVIQYQDTTIWLDPWSKGQLSGRPPADVLLLTDIHPDHLDEAAIAKVVSPTTVVVGPQAVADARKEAGHEAQAVISNGQTTVVRGISITAVPMYNLVRGPKEGGLYHDKGRGNGYVLEADGTRLYIAGDTECTDEMKALKNIDLAFVPMNLPYTMPPDEAAACVAAFAPKTVVPFHYRDADRSVFQAGLQSHPEISVRIEDFYPQPKP